ncbi:MAG: sterol desaturase family protein, partial [Myxococcota bacterium]|nr:sterol desaturase family protein [Myxococcota bacterium]
FALLEMSDDSVGTWILGFVGVDLCYYFYHRFSHRVNFAWATHVVHHQSEEYNLAVALRQPWFTQIYAWTFYIPLAILGVPTMVQATAYAFNLLYQFWIHTRLIHRMGPLEWVLNTPSHHRVHHGTDPAYVDKNYGGILIIWDRLFGTFAQETTEPVYGTLKPLKSWNPLWANVAPWVSLARGSASMDGWGDKVRNWFMPPGWAPGGVVEPTFPAPDRGYDSDAPTSVQIYVLVHMLPVSIVMTRLMNVTPEDPVWMLVLGAGSVFWAVMAWAAIFQRRSWTLPLELSRLAVLAGLGAWWTLSGTVWPDVGPVVVVLAVASLVWFWSRRGFISPRGFGDSTV